MIVPIKVKGTEMPTAYDPEAIAQYLKEIKAANEGSKGHLLSVGWVKPFLRSISHQLIVKI